MTINWDAPHTIHEVRRTLRQAEDEGQPSLEISTMDMREVMTYVSELTDATRPFFHLLRSRE